MTLVGHEVNGNAEASLFDGVDSLRDDKTAVVRVSIRLKIGSPRLVVLTDGNWFAPVSWIYRHQYDPTFGRDRIAINSAGIARNFHIVVDITETL
ncbi:hypothetical protein ACFQHK_17675 [Halomarina ordinaria]|uniref:Uncharacterized protein n=1 Tax=Halomarina ordinaria TaxID=3033939 RepID=A0ABD5UHI2_9EURY|nr:hypothetical protein [Halomarina sp. PSRA2]